MKRRYWAVRTDKDNQELIFKELKLGRFRQGWGYNDSQDLRVIQSEITKGGKWWARLTSIQNEVLRHFRMLGEGDDSIKIGDILLLPNLPQHKFFCLAEVTGKYYFERLQLNSKQDINQLGADYGHILPTKLLTPNGINKFNNYVNADIRSTLKTRIRMWSLNGYESHIEKLLSVHSKGEELTIATTGSERLNSAWEKAIQNAKESLYNQLTKELDSKFQAAEWEEPILNVLKNLYQGLEIRKTAGSGEHGADFVIEIPDFFDEDIPWYILIQVKNYVGEIGEQVLNQIEDAYNYYRKDGKILAGIILTTAERISKNFEMNKKALQNRLSKDIKIILRKRLIELISEGLSNQLFLKQE